MRPGGASVADAVALNFLLDISVKIQDTVFKD
jgi:hypothetical protein